MVGTFIAGYGAEMLWGTLQHISMVRVALVLGEEAVTRGTRERGEQT